MKKALLIILAFIVLGSGLLYTQKEKIKEAAVDYLVSQLEANTQCKVNLKGVSYSFPIHFQIEQAFLYSEEKPIAEFENFSCSISPFHLTQKEIVVTNCKMETLKIHNLLKHPKTSLQQSESAEPSVRNFPKIKISQFQIHKFSIENSLINNTKLKEYAHYFTREMPLTIRGKFELSKTECIADIDLSRNTHPTDQLQLSLSLQRIEDDIRSHVRLTLFEDSLFAEWFAFPKKSNLQIVLDITGKEKTWKQVLALNFAEAMQPLLGDFQISFSSSQRDFELEGQLIASSTDGIFINSLAGNSGSVNLQGSIHIDPQLKIDDTAIKISVQELPNELFFLTNLEMHCDLSGSLLSPMYALETTFGKAEFNNVFVHNFHSKIQGTFNNNTLLGFLETNALVNGAGCSFTSDVELSKTNALLYNLAGKIDQKNWTGRVEFDLEQRLCQAYLSGEINVASFHDEAEGNTLFEIDVKPLQNNQYAIDISLDSQEIKVKNFASVDPRINLSFSGSLVDMQCAVKGNAKSLTYDHNRLTNVNIETNIDSANHFWPFTITSHTDDKDSLCHFKGYWHLSSTSFGLNANQLEGKIQKHSFALKEPFEIFCNNGEFAISPIALLVDESVLTCKIKLNPYINAQTIIEKVNLDLVRFFVPSFPLHGIASGQAELFDNGKNIVGSIKVDIQNSLAKLAQHPIYEGSLTLKLNNNGIESTGNLTLTSQQFISFDLFSPIHITSKPYSIQIDDSFPIHGKMVAKGKVETIFELLVPTSTPNVTGFTDIAFDVSGTFDKPEIKGKGNLHHASFELGNLGIVFQNVSAHVDLDGNKAILTNLEGRDGHHGILKGNGYAILDPNENIPFDLSLDIENATFHPSDYMNAVANGKIRLHGNVDGGSLEGQITTESVQIAIPDRMPALTHTIEISYINQPKNVPPPTMYRTNPAETWPLSLNLELNIPRNAIISGKDWSSEWKGNVSITGNTSSPLMHGNYKVVGGEYKFNGKSFKIKEGTITFSGDPEKKTNLFIVAGRDLDSMTAEIVLKGPMSNPGISFRSSPPMSQREILSWILFNKGISDISPFQGSQLSESITGLNVDNDQEDMLTKLKNRIGIDKIDITRGSGESNDVSVQVGKYISNGILISIQKSVTAETNRVGIEADLINNFKAQAEVGDDSDAQLRLKWKKDY